MFNKLILLIKSEFINMIINLQLLLHFCPSSAKGWHILPKTWFSAAQSQMCTWVFLKYNKFSAVKDASQCTNWTHAQNLHASRTVCANCAIDEIWANWSILQPLNTQRVTDQSFCLSLFSIEDNFLIMKRKKAYILSHLHGNSLQHSHNKTERKWGRQ